MTPKTSQLHLLPTQMSWALCQEYTLLTFSLAVGVVLLVTTLIHLIENVLITRLYYLHLISALLGLDCIPIGKGEIGS